MMLKIVTDNKWKHFKYGHEVPRKIRTADFDWLTDDKGVSDDLFIHYRRRWYHLSEFMCSTKKAVPTRLDERSIDPLAEWDGVMNDTFFSGVAIKVSSDGESYKICTFYS